MRNSILFLVFLICSCALRAQSTNYDIVEGDLLLLGPPSGSEYTSIDFPRKNIIHKRGAIANFHALIGKRLVVQKIDSSKNDEVIAILKRDDGLNFFRFFPKVTANLSQAIKSGELKVSK